MSRLDDLFTDYASYHGTTGNKICHRIGIPMILVSLLGMLARLEVPGTGGWLDAGIILILIAEIFYFALDWKYGILMLFVAAGAWALGSAIPMSWNVILFVGGWILQFVGHGVYEKRAPAFARNLTHLLVGPVWILADVLPNRGPARSAS